MALLLSIAIASTEVPLWISFFSFVMITWKYLNEKFLFRKIPVKLTPLIGVFIFIIVYLQYKTILGQEESTTVLLGLVSLSILNYETDRDTLFLVLLGFLILVIKSVFSLDFIWTLPALLSFFGLWFSLLTNHQINKFKFLYQTTRKSIPLLVGLFILFPRLVIFQSKPANRVIVQSGFNEDLNPGRFSEVALSNQMVFRAEFKNNRMNAEELYWRGTVLNISKGFVWQKGVVDKVLVPANDRGIEAINYKVILEPLSLKNIFVLDKPVRIVAASTPISELSFGSYALNELQTQQVQFEAKSVFNSTETDYDDPPNLQKYLYAPDLAPKTRGLVKEISEKNPTPKARIAALQKFFAQKGFIYTLKPEFYQNNMDEFLFERKKGFCEHFAASFASVARALGVPSRVVLGYQGGIYNPVGNFWKISQRDAHSWVEVGLEGRWVRIDPTALVAPLRIAIGGENYFSLSEDEQILFSKNREWKKPQNLQVIISQVSLYFENLNYVWTVFLLNYDLQTQIDYLKQFQGNWLVGSFFILLFILFLVYNRRRKKREARYRHEMYSLFLKVEKWGLKKGLEFHDFQTPHQILNLISAKYPQLKENILKIQNQYTKVVYEEKVPEVQTSEINEQWKEASQKVN